MKKTDYVLNGLTALFSSIGIIILFAITYYIFSNGLSTLSWDLITSDYHDQVYTSKFSEDEEYKIGNFENPSIESTYFSKNFGISLTDSTDINNNKIVKIEYIDKLSPFNNLIDASDNTIKITVGQCIEKIIITNDAGDYIIATSNDGAEEMISMLDRGDVILDMTTAIKGGGIRGSIVATLLLIVTTMIIALPIGVFAAIYLCEYASNSKITNVLRSMIDITSGIPSIIFGLVGVVVFIPFVNTFSSSTGGSILSGAFTLSVMLLPIIIRTTSDALKNVPNSFRQASLALGASKTQTIFKVVLPNAISGILTATILSIGKVIGESAALIYAIGTAIKDKIVLTDKATTLAVHIWSLMSGDNPNFEVSCAISIIILISVFILSISVKIIAKKLNKYEVSN